MTRKEKHLKRLLEAPSAELTQFEINERERLLEEQDRIRQKHFAPLKEDQRKKDQRKKDHDELMRLCSPPDLRKKKKHGCKNS